MITQRLEQPQPRRGHERCRPRRAGHGGPGSRVDREEHRHVFRNCGDARHQPLEPLWIVDVARSVQRQQGVFAFPDAVSGRRGEPARPLPVREQRVDHHVADQVDTLVGNPFPPQVLERRGFGREEIVRQMIGQHAVDLFGHAPVEASEAGLDVCDREAHLRSHQRARQGRVDVAHDDDEIGRPILQHLFEPHHDRRCLLGMAARADGERGVRRSDLELVEEDL